MARQFLTPIDLSRNELRNARIQNLASAPGSPPAGLLYFDTSLGALRFFDGSDWVDVISMEGTITSVSVAAPITSTGGTSPTIGINEATTSTSGAMSGTDKTKLDGIAPGATANDDDASLRDRSTHTGTQAQSTIVDLEDDLAAKQSLSERGEPDGYTPLDSSGKVPTSHLPALAISSTFVVADITARDALTVQEGDVAIVQDKGDGQPSSYIYDGTDWQELLTPFTGVSDVTGGTGITSTGGDTPEISITNGGVGTTQIADEAVTEAKLSTAVQTKLNAPGGALKYAETIGDGTATSFPIVHNIGTRDVQVSLHETASPWAQVEAGVEHTDLNTVTISFASAPSAGQFRAVVVG